MSEQPAMPGNTDPWAGPVDQAAHARWAAKFHAECKRLEWQNPRCGCWSWDCAECGQRMSQGKRPTSAQLRKWGSDTTHAVQATP